MKLNSFKLILVIFFLTLTMNNFTSAQDSSTLTKLLTNVSGGQKSIASIASGKVTIVSFWATWCEPCKKEQEAMNNLYSKLTEKSVEYIAVSIDNTKTMAKVAPYVKSKGYTFPVLIDSNSDIFKALNGDNVPYTVIFNKRGSIVEKHEGYLKGDEKKIFDKVMSLVK